MSKRLDELPVPLALEIDALCDDFERHWRRAARSGGVQPGIESFVARASPAARPVLRHWLSELADDFQRGVALPEIPGMVVEEEIGRGGMGVVYRARRPDGQLIAVKLIPGTEHARWFGWLAELAKLRHPNLLPVEAFGTHQRLHYIVMPLVSGGDLKERLHEFQNDRLAAQLVAKLAAAVGFLHRHGILHRDIKPSNILLASRRPECLQITSEEIVEPLVCDFGLAGRIDSSETQQVVGTPAYMAPEQREGRPLTPAADVWGIGAVLRDLLGGGTNDKLGRICQRCLAHDPAARYPTANEVVDDLARFANL